jgi:serine/threonine protein kinase
MSINSFVGTANYLAPEILNKCKVGFGIDLWSLGLILYEMLHGYPAFVDRTEYLTFKRISLLKFAIDTVDLFYLENTRRCQRSYIETLGLRSG